MTYDPQQCAYVIEGPRVPRTRSAIMWRKRCKNKRTKDSAFCWRHKA